MLQAQSNEGTSMVWLSSFQLSRVNSPDDSSEKMSPRVRVRVTYAGRLDKDSEGLILLTNDGDLIQALMKGSNHHEKEYVVKVDKEITPAFLEKMASGVYLKELDQTTRPCHIEQVGKLTFKIVLTQGLNRQIRRMTKELGYNVTGLKRIRIEKITIDGLKIGQYRELTEREKENLYETVGLK